MQPRRSYSKPSKAQVIQDCAQPGDPIASITLNTNLVHKWIQVQTQKNTELPAYIYSVTHTISRSKLARCIVEYLR